MTSPQNMIIRNTASGLERREMSWEQEGELFNELYWISVEGQSQRPRDAEYAERVFNKYAESTHEEPDGLMQRGINQNIYDYLTPTEIDILETTIDRVEVVMTIEDWAIVDRLLGYKFSAEPEPPPHADDTDDIDSQQPILAHRVARQPYVHDGAPDTFQRSWFSPNDPEYQVINGIRYCSLCGQPFGLHDDLHTPGQQVDHWCGVHYVSFNPVDVAPHWHTPDPFDPS